MEVKTFEAFTMKDAIKAVKAEFGHDAVILRTKDRQNENGHGKIYEVTAAPSGSSFRAGAKKNSGDGQSLIAREDLIAWQRTINDLGRKVQHLEDVTIRREQLDSLELGLFEVRSLLSEFVSKKGGDLYKDLNEELREMVRRLKLMEVEDKELIELSKYLKALPAQTNTKSGNSFDYYQAHAIKWMLKRIKIAPLWNPVMGERQLQVIVGPTGSGKTATVAKLAARFFLKEEKSTVVFSFDNQRLGATEQMRIFSKVIGTPFEVVSRLEDIEKLLVKHDDKDLIILDTAGRSPKSASSIEELKCLKDLMVAVNYHLVISVTDKKHQIERNIKGFNPLGLQSLIFTKLDESWSYGEIFNAGLKWGIPLSYFGIGQRMPEDLERASRERVVERIFGL